MQYFLTKFNKKDSQNWIFFRNIFLNCESRVYDQHLRARTPMQNETTTKRVFVQIRAMFIVRTFCLQRGQRVLLIDGRGSIT
jgi:hypothetical protein